MRSKGQIVLILVLIMTVALAIGLSIVQKSLTDVSISSKVEESARAFSAAEAGIEKALKGDTALQNFSNASSIKQITGSNYIPCIPGDAGPPPCTQTAGQQQLALEYPALSKEEVAQVWLADLNSSSNPPADFYKQTSLDIYWGALGSSSVDKPALDLKVIYYDVTGYHYQPNCCYFDSNSSRAVSNGFTDAGSNCNSPSPITTILGSNRSFLCKTTILSLPSTGLMLLRARFLYSPASQPFAVSATFPQSGCSGNNCYLPPQAKLIKSIGTAGVTQRSVQVFQLNKVVPPYFDYAIFSVGEIRK